jgi:hypothetical protein
MFRLETIAAGGRMILSDNLSFTKVSDCEFTQHSSVCRRADRSTSPEKLLCNSPVFDTVQVPSIPLGNIREHHPVENVSRPSFPSQRVA